MDNNKSIAHPIYVNLLSSIQYPLMKKSVPSWQKHQTINNERQKNCGEQNVHNKKQKKWSYARKIGKNLKCILLTEQTKCFVQNIIVSSYEAFHHIILFFHPSRLLLLHYCDVFLDLLVFLIFARCRLHPDYYSHL